MARSPRTPEAAARAATSQEIRQSLTNHRRLGIETLEVRGDQLARWATAFGHQIPEGIILDQSTVIPLSLKELSARTPTQMSRRIDDIVSAPNFASRVQEV